MLPAYCRSSSGRVFRLLRSSELVAPGRVRFSLRAQAITADGPNHPDLERTREVDADVIRDKIQHRQAIPTPEATFEDLWQQLRLDLDAHDGPYQP